MTTPADLLAWAAMATLGGLRTAALPVLMPVLMRLAPVRQVFQRA